MNLEFHPAAAAELEAAVKDGVRFGRGLGLRLRLEVARVALLLSDTPNIGEPIVGACRRFPLSGFPFSIIYSLDGDVLRVLAIAHKRRSPEYWMKRQESGG